MAGGGVFSFGKEKKIRRPIKPDQQPHINIKLYAFFFFALFEYEGKKAVYIPPYNIYALSFAFLLNRLEWSCLSENVSNTLSTGCAPTRSPPHGTSLSVGNVFRNKNKAIKCFRHIFFFCCFHFHHPRLCSFFHNFLFLNLITSLKFIFYYVSTSSNKQNHLVV
jgi:hypothetical protein